MKRYFTLCLFLLSLSGLASASSLDRARLFDWYYPSEESYQVLKRVASAQNRRGWLVDEMRDSKSIPQASARELALDLAQDPTTTAEDKKALKNTFVSEASAIVGASAEDLGSIEPLEQKFAKLNLRMNELEETIKKNNFSKQSYPTITGAIRTGYVNNSAWGMMENNNQANFAGGVTINFNGQGNGGGFGFSIAQNYDTADRSAQVGFPHRNYGLTLPNFQIGYSDATFSMQLGAGGVLIKNGLVQGSSARPGAPNIFAVEVESDWLGRPNNPPAELKLGLPTGTWEIKPAIYLKKQGTAKYWPFQLFELYYAPWVPDNPVYWGTGVQTDFGSFWGLVDHHLINAVVNGSFLDEDRLRSFSKPDDSSSSFAWGLGSETLLSSGGQLYLEYGQSNRDIANRTANLVLIEPADLAGYVPGGPAVKGFVRRYGGEAFAGAFTQPFGVVTLGLEYSHIGPLFTPALGSPAAQLSPTGALINSVDNKPSKGTMTPYPGAPKAKGYVAGDGSYVLDSEQDLAWGTAFEGATGYLNNTEKVVGQGQLSYSWVSVGAFSGVARQINPSGPWLHTKPILEAGDTSASGLIYLRMAGTWANPPAPLSPNPGPGGTYNQWAFNRPADGNASYDSTGATIPIHWNAMGQVNWRTLEYWAIFSKNGVGDNRMDPVGVKYVNYSAGTLTLNFQDLLGRTLPFLLQMYGESRDLAPQSGFTTFGNAGQAGKPDSIYFNQSTSSVFLKYGWNQVLNSVAILSHEEWHSTHSFFPINVGVSVYGTGLDYDAGKLLTGLNFYWRTYMVNLEDYNFRQRNFSILQTQVSTNLSF